MANLMVMAGVRDEDIVEMWARAYFEDINKKLESELTTIGMTHSRMGEDIALYFELKTIREYTSSIRAISGEISALAFLLNDAAQSLARFAERGGFEGLHLLRYQLGGKVKLVLTRNVNMKDAPWVIEINGHHPDLKPIRNRYEKSYGSSYIEAYNSFLMAGQQIECIRR